ncbi:hypothetical protein F4815DRAFT_462611 [Daldinia loculata]|uniref:uncharacterized protein n=1 Tax=Daldinia loculata TaxID=103429 RepID=UPI0020C438D8|nr:uncharacterized protein F4817DRAFT_335764 [Daldinia loculata]KAI1648068.1 hypothetical protein F4817DRAFT_335764 [Daldinia loculata]KAI2782314.1 hypothetical protein F4815DRAFT_462611 [Daldinia loculata]
MAPRRKEPTPTEADSGSDVELNFNFNYKPSTSVPQAMESIDRWKSKRAEIQKGIDKDYTERLTGLKNKIKKHYHDETRKMSSHNQQQLQRLIAALEKRITCEEEIRNRIDSLRDDCAHMAMLIDAIYAGRKEAAAQSAKVANPSQPKN